MKGKKSANSREYYEIMLSFEVAIRNKCACVGGLFKHKTKMCPMVAKFHKTLMASPF